MRDADPGKGPGQGKGQGKGEGAREAAGSGTGGEVARVYPYTLDGLRQALDEARFRSYGGRPQLLAVVAGDQSRVIRRYEHGKEVPVTPLPPTVALSWRYA